MATPPAWVTRQPLGISGDTIELRPNSVTNRLLSLTLREIQVLEWIAAGKRDKEIGRILNISSRTAQKHVEHILQKLHVETRGAAAAAWYQQRQLLPR